MATLREKFRGCMLGAVVGDVVGAAVEAESPGYIAKTFRSVDEILATETVEEFTGPPWRVGRFTDDTQMTICVAEWLLAGETDAPQRLLARFADAYEPWRRYGPGTAGILRLFESNRDHWRELATAMFPHGSHGNGGAMRVAPVGLAHFRDTRKAAAVARESSRPTHSHPLAYQGASVQAVAVALATAAVDGCLDPAAFLQPLRETLHYFSDFMQDTSTFDAALDAIGHRLARGASCSEMSQVLGTGVTAQEAVPMALYCFLCHPDSYADVIHDAVFIGGDTDTIACMAGALSGAFLGAQAIPAAWRQAVREPEWSALAIEELADRLWERFGRDVGAAGM
jgi:poly(ADP-ribose) glycohydrolase ARH3